MNGHKGLRMVRDRVWKGSTAVERKLNETRHLARDMSGFVRVEHAISG